MEHRGCVASASSLRNTRPGASMRMGGFCCSMTRICMGLVCVRSRTESSSVKIEGVGAVAGGMALFNVQLGEAVVGKLDSGPSGSDSPCR